VYIYFDYKEQARKTSPNVFTYLTEQLTPQLSGLPGHFEASQKTKLKEGVARSPYWVFYPAFIGDIKALHPSICGL
jgi:hypothetical protein